MKRITIKIKSLKIFKIIFKQIVYIYRKNKLKKENKLLYQLHNLRDISQCHLKTIIILLSNNNNINQ